MARPRKPTAVLELTGAFKHNPQRKRPNEPKESRPLGDPPARLPAAARRYWRELADMAGVSLTRRDRWTVELAARLMDKAATEVTAKAVFSVVGEQDVSLDGVKKLQIEVEFANPSISGAELSTLTKLLCAMGMDPASRSKLSIPTNEKPVNRYAALATEIKAASQKPN